MTSCIFCDILDNKLALSMVYAGEEVSAFMDIQPVNAGHVLVLPNQHADYLADLDEEIGGQVFKLAQRVAAAIRQTDIRCEGINFFLADGEAAMQDVFHVHLHVIPRYVGDDFKLSFGPEYQNLPERANLDQQAEKIRAELEAK